MRRGQLIEYLRGNNSFFISDCNLGWRFFGKLLFAPKTSRLDAKRVFNRWDREMHNRLAPEFFNWVSVTERRGLTVNRIYILVGGGRSISKEDCIRRWQRVGGCNGSMRDYRRHCFWPYVTEMADRYALYTIAANVSGWGTPEIEDE